MRIPRIIALVLSIQLAAAVCSAGPYPLTFLTEENPPFHYTDKGVLKGMAVDVLHRMWVRMGEPRQEITVMPWVRAYEAAQTRPGTVLFITARLPAREKLFKWVGPITTSKLVLLSTSKKDISLRSDADIARYRVGVVKDDVAELIMRNMGIPKDRLDTSPDHKASVMKLLAGRVDMMVKGEKSLNEFLKGIGQNPDDFKVLRKVAGVQVCFAFHKDTPDSVIKQYQDALNALKSDGTLGRIIRQYQPE
jgi:ABC-type amino acid transport substrate-binding protein